MGNKTKHQTRLGHRPAVGRGLLTGWAGKTKSGGGSHLGFKKHQTSPGESGGGHLETVKWLFGGEGHCFRKVGVGTRPGGSPEPAAPGWAPQRPLRTVLWHRVPGHDDGGVATASAATLVGTRSPAVDAVTTGERAETPAALTAWTWNPYAVLGVTTAVKVAVGSRTVPV